jgi:hypothetical protein
MPFAAAKPACEACVIKDISGHLEGFPRRRFPVEKEDLIGWLVIGCIT